MNAGSIDKVAMVARSEESRAATAHQQQQELATQSQQRLGQLEQFRAEYEERLKSMASGGMDARQMADYRRFLAGLNDAIERQNEEVVRTEESVAGSREQLLQRSMRRESIDTLADRTRAAMLQAEERRDQLKSDELAMERHQGE